MCRQHTSLPLTSCTDCPSAAPEQVARTPHITALSILGAIGALTLDALPWARAAAVERTSSGNSEGAKITFNIIKQRLGDVMYKITAQKFEDPGEGARLLPARGLCFWVFQSVAAAVHLQSLQANVAVSRWLGRQRACAYAGVA